MPPAENSKEFSTPEPPADPGECGPQATQIVAAAATDAKPEATPPIADGSSSPLTSFSIFRFILINFVFSCEGSTPTVVADKPRASFSSWSVYHKQNPNFEASVPWCRLLSQSAQVIYLLFISE